MISGLFTDPNEASVGLNDFAAEETWRIVTSEWFSASPAPEHRVAMAARNQPRTRLRVKWLFTIATISLLVASLIACTAPVQTGTAHIGQQTKTSGCLAVGSLPDGACTPGAIFATATKDEICQPGYSKNVRDVSEPEKNQDYAEYGIRTRSTGEYEVDHLISLELGGSNDIANLWPEPANPRPGFHEKDQVENFLHEQVCSGTLPLAQAQEEIAMNWLDVYNQMPKTR